MVERKNMRFCCRYCNKSGKASANVLRILTLCLLLIFSSASGNAEESDSPLVYTPISGVMSDCLQLEGGDFIKAIIVDEQDGSADHKVIRTDTNGGIAWMFELVEFSDINRPAEVMLMPDGSIAVLCYGDKDTIAIHVVSQDGEGVDTIASLTNATSCILVGNGFLVSHTVKTALEDMSSTYDYTFYDWDGEEFWVRRLAGYDDGIIDCLVTDDGYIMSLYVDRGTEQNYTKAAIFMLDSDGEFVWDYTFEPSDGFQPLYFKLLETSDNSYLGTGWYATWNNEHIGNYYGIVTLLDKTGKSIWEKVYESNYALQLTNSKDTADGYDIVFEAQDNGQGLVYNGILAVDKTGVPVSCSSMLVGDHAFFLVKSFEGNDTFWGMGNVVEIIDGEIGDDLSFVYPIDDLEDEGAVRIKLRDIK